LIKEDERASIYGAPGKRGEQKRGGSEGPFHLKGTGGRTDQDAQKVKLKVRCRHLHCESEKDSRHKGEACGGKNKWGMFTIESNVRQPGRHFYDQGGLEASKQGLLEGGGGLKHKK